MIPEFPNFKQLELTDKEEVEKFTSKFPPYSDFNFFSMWSWDIYNKMMLSQLNDNLVVLFNDYVSGDKFLSFIGDKEILETTGELISFSEKKYKENFLKLIPEEILLDYKKSDFITKTDRDSYDYIYLVEHLTKMDKWSDNPCGRKIRQFIKKFPNYVVKGLSTKEIQRSEYKNLFESWSFNKNIGDIFDLNEYKAFERFLEINDENIIYVTLYIDGVLAGFSVYEILPNHHALAHFSKADTKNYSGAFDVLNWEEAKFMESKGIKYLNWEQDLGIPGLRYSKEKYRPSFLMRKFIVSTQSKK